MCPSPSVWQRSDSKKPWIIPIQDASPSVFPHVAHFQLTNRAEQTERTVARSRTHELYRSSVRLCYLSMCATSESGKKTHWTITDGVNADCVFTYRPINSSDMSRHTHRHTSCKPFLLIFTQFCGQFNLFTCEQTPNQNYNANMYHLFFFFSGANEPNYRWGNIWKPEATVLCLSRQRLTSVSWTDWSMDRQVVWASSLPVKQRGRCQCTTRRIYHYIGSNRHTAWWGSGSRRSLHLKLTSEPAELV